MANQTNVYVIPVRSDVTECPTCDLLSHRLMSPQEKLQTFAFLVFVAVCILASVYLYIVLPETKNKTFMDISQSFAKINKIPNPSPSEEMEMVLSITPGPKKDFPDRIKVESSF